MARLGDLMPRPTAIDFDLMLMKDVYMILQRTRMQCSRGLSQRPTAQAEASPPARSGWSQGHKFSIPADNRVPSRMSQGPQDPTPALLALRKSLRAPRQHRQHSSTGSMAEAENRHEQRWLRK